MRQRIFIASKDNREALEALVFHVVDRFLNCGKKCLITVSENRRSIRLNALLHGMLRDIARQVKWPVNGVEQNLSVDDWKSIFTAALQRETRLAPGIDGGVVIIGARTRDMSSREMSELIDMIDAFGSERNVKWSHLRMEHEPEI